MNNKSIILVFAVLLGLSYTFPTYAQYVQDRNKVYTPEQYERRQKIYDAKIQSFQNSDTPYNRGVNNMTDWTPEEIRALSHLNQVPNPVSSTKRVIRRQFVGNTTNATELDWRDENAVTPIKDQGSCGACWAFAAAAYAESKLIIAGKYTADNIDLSEQYIYECTQDSDCNGGYLQYALETAYNVPTEEEYPYNPDDSNTEICFVPGIQVGFEAQNEYGVDDDVMIELLQDSPIAASVASGSWSDYTSGIFECQPEDVIDHAILIVGYTEDYWIVKNQWSADWGEDGYIRITRDRTNNKNCGLGTSVHYMFQKFSYLTLLALILAFAALY